MGLDMSKFNALDDHGNVHIINSKAAWDAKILDAQNTGRVVVVDFTASWCGPCKMMAPLFAELSNTHEQLIFVKVDVDEMKDIAREWNVTAMPTFIFIKNGKMVDKVVGANKNELQRKVQQFASQS